MIGALSPMEVADLDAVVQIEQQVYEFPWSRNNFVDSLTAGYWAFVIRHPVLLNSCLTGYYLAMVILDEVHLLNMTVDVPYQGQGLGHFMLKDLIGRSTQWGAKSLWLEVRQSNRRAQHIYQDVGFSKIATRPHYYPSAHMQREDAVLMKMEIENLRESSHGLV
jgi:[ribosomal protein S18]-alanine N-acetyltransferase